MSLSELAERALRRAIAVDRGLAPETAPSAPRAGETPSRARWTLRCDRPGCGAELAAVGATDTLARRAVTFKAEAEDWQISRWRDVPVDLCPEHREESWQEGPPRRVLEAGIRDGRVRR